MEISSTLVKGFQVSWYPAKKKLRKNNGRSQWENVTIVPTAQALVKVKKTLAQLR